MKLVVLTVSPGRVAWLSEITDLYKKKINPYSPFEIIYVKPKEVSRDDRELKKAKESQALLDRIDVRDFVILCDERGKAQDSRDFSKTLSRALESGRHRVVIIVGGAFGASEELKKRANLTWKLSDLTLSHWVAQTVVLEQVYRALTIWKGINYHND